MSAENAAVGWSVGAIKKDVAGHEHGKTCRVQVEPRYQALDYRLKPQGIDDAVGDQPRTRAGERRAVGRWDIDRDRAAYLWPEVQVVAGADLVELSRSFGDGFLS